MTFNLFCLLASLPLLWLPLPASAPKSSRYQNRLRVPNATLRGLLRAWQNWADLVRSGVGAWLLWNEAITVAPPNPADESSAFVLKAAILSLGLAVQTFRFGSEASFIAPLFYLTGMTFTICWPAAGAFAILFGWTFAWRTKGVQFQAPVMGVALAIGGFLINGYSRALVLNCAFIFSAPFLAMLYQKRLLFVARERRLSTPRIRSAPADDLSAVQIPPVGR